MTKKNKNENLWLEFHFFLFFNFVHFYQFWISRLGIFLKCWLVVCELFWCAGRPTRAMNSTSLAIFSPIEARKKKEDATHKSLFFLWSKSNSVARNFVLSDPHLLFNIPKWVLTILCFSAISPGRFRVWDWMFFWQCVGLRIKWKRTRCVVVSRGMNGMSSLWLAGGT